jgi:hypothetical protein
MQFLSLLGCAAVLLRLSTAKLLRVYPVFAAYLLLPLILEFIAVAYGICSPKLCVAYSVLEPLRALGFACAIAELVFAVIRNHLQAREWRISVIAGFASVGLVFAFIAPHSDIFHGLIQDIVRLERGIAFSSAVFILGFLGVATRAAITLPRNLNVLLAFWCLWLLGDAVMLTAASFLPAGGSVVVNDGLALFEVGSYVGWILMLRKSSETRDPDAFLLAANPAS